MTSLLKIGNLFSKLSIAPGRLTNSYSTSTSSFGLMKCLMPNSTRPLVSTVGQFVAPKCVSNSVGSSSIPSRNYETYSFTEHLSGYLKRRIKNGLPKVGRKRNSPTEGQPFLKGIVLKTLIKKPKKPNSANRKCVRVRLSTGREATAYVPGIGHNLQEHHIVLVRGGKMQDLPGVKLKCVRGKYDLQHVKKQS